MAKTKRKRWGSIYTLTFYLDSKYYSQKIHGMSAPDARDEIKKRHPKATKIKIISKKAKYH